MHGMIFKELRGYVDAKLGAQAWDKLLKEAGLGSKVFLVSESYPDQEIGALVTTASKITNTPVPAILEDFGEYIVPDLVKMYKAYMKPEWKTLDVLENAETSMHKAVRMQNTNAKPPALICKRTGPKEVVITYSSNRKMCGVGKGIAKGLAKLFKETISVSEPSCMLSGGPKCEIHVKQN